MKKLIKITLFFVICSLYNCGSINVEDVWKSPNISDSKDGRFLVIARTNNLTNRIAFERKITDALNSKGIKAVSSYTKFPFLDPDAKITDERKAMIKKLLEEENFNCVVLTSLKDVKERTTTSSNYYYNDPWDTFYPRYYGGFYSYYYYPYYNVNVNISGSETTYTSKTYYLETVAFDIDAPDGNQLLAVVTTSIDNPNDVQKTATKYTKELMEALVQK